MTRATSSGGRIEHEGRVDDGLSLAAGSAWTALLSLGASLFLGLRDGGSLRTSLSVAAVVWAGATVVGILRRRQRVRITAGEVVVRTWHGRTVRIPRESIAHVLHLRRAGSRAGGLVSLLDEDDLPLWRFWTDHWSDETVAALIGVGRRTTVEDVLPQEDESVHTPRMSRARRAARLVLQGLLVAFGLACLVLALLVIALDWLSA